MNLYDKFSTRQVIEPEEAEIVVRDDAPAELRNAFVQIAYEAGLLPTQLRQVVCRVLRTEPDTWNWTDFPNVDDEVKRRIGECKWYEVWHAYFRVAETPLVFRRIDEWIRHRLRQVYLKQWKRGPTIYRELRARGASDALARSVAFGAQRWWHHASLRIHQLLTNAHFDQLGVPRLAT